MRKNVLSTFLRGLADSIDKNKLTESNVQRISEFYMSYLFLNKVKQRSEKEFQKFLFLGWYVYKNLLNKS
jgi:hypothetical protein